MKTMVSSSHRGNHGGQVEGKLDTGLSDWQEKAAHHRNQQRQAYQNRSNKELVRRVIAKVSAL